ncbi:MAG: response regulator [Anaeromicrobium sp.]|jgi:two-component system chemotaxis response regulator CheY|uniref:response regulator n=1 Tax=Anaeromicrobium sp. TaxID=1929132 RepID=UPI0025F00374|nr:response regulator [Anaeromicrobium sp.]MCT4593676.1 response regulator [Anaeromicrobium sp.]
MRILIAEDDLTSRLFMKKYLSEYGTCDVVMNGMEAIDLVMNSIEMKKPYDLICLDIMMPKVDGIKALKIIRKIERTSLDEGFEPAKIIMTTALNDKETVKEAYECGCEAYAWKPIDIEKFNEVLKKLCLI